MTVVVTGRKIIPS